MGLVSWSQREARAHVLQIVVIAFLRQVGNKDIGVGEGIGNKTPKLEDSATCVFRD